MSNFLAIAAVTATLRSLLASGLAADASLSDAQVTAQPLDKARDAAATVNQLNLFLYLISPNAAWRNQDMPGLVRPGEVASPPLALNLFYLLSAYGRDDDAEAPFSHMLLGQAMSTLYDHPVLSQTAIAAALAGNDLASQIERVRITLQPLSIEDISKLWAGFQMQYRLSVAYEVAVVLIDTARPVRAALPVLARGQLGRGFPAIAGLASAWPQITTLAPPRPLRVGDTLKVAGTGLVGDTIVARFAPAWHGSPVQLAAAADGNGGFTVTIPAAPAIAAGPCMFSLVLTTNSQLRPTNELPLMMAPLITSNMPATVALGGGNPTLSLTIVPSVLAGQRVALILGSSEVPAATVSDGQLTFTLTGVTEGTYPARVRVDGVDSLPLIDPDVPIPKFDPAQAIVVTA